MSKHILLCVNPARDPKLETAAEAASLLREAGHEVLVSLLPEEGTERLASSVALTPLSVALPDAALLITLGGDGTILLAARLVEERDIPILGVNLGHKGFLTQLERSELSRLIEAARGEYAPQRRMLLDVELRRGGESVLRACALNDAAINGVVNTIPLTVYGDGVKIMEFSGDGLVIATPTGATGYSMSAGGPLVEPDARNIILTPVCAHQLAVRSFVLAPERAVSVHFPELHGKRALLSIDGAQSMALLPEDEIRVSVSERTLCMPRLRGKSFYDTAYTKLSARL